MDLIYLFGNSFDLPVEFGLVLFVDEDPLLDVGQVPEFMQVIDGLGEVVADVVEVFSELQHIGEEVIERFVAVALDDRLAEEDFAAVFADGGAGGLAGEHFELLVLIRAHADGEPFCAFVRLIFHVFSICRNGHF
jgi:hypothetical protein